MTFWEFASVCPFTTVALAMIVAITASSILCWPFRLVNRWIRHRNIVVKGWPPPHLDADGDSCSEY